MANLRISELGVARTPIGTDLMEIVQADDADVLLNYKATIDQVRGVPWTLDGNGTGSGTAEGFNAFTAITNAWSNELYTSNTLTISGPADMTWPLVVRGDGTPQMSINGGTWCSESCARNGDTIKLRLTSSSLVSTVRTATVYAPGRSASYSVTTMAWIPSSVSTPLEWTAFRPGFAYSDIGLTTQSVHGGGIYTAKDIAGGYNSTYVVGTPTSQPILNISGDIYSGVFDGNNDGMYAAVPIGSTCTICFCAKETSASPVSGPRIINARVINGLVSGRRAANGFYTSGNVKNTLGVSDSNYHVYTIRKNPAGTTFWTLRIDGVDQTGLTNRTTDWGTGIAWGTDLTAGQTESFQGNAAGRVIYNSHLTGTDLTNLETYVGKLGGLTI